jgi:hypothetical protein
LAAVAAAATALVSGVGWLTLTGALGRVQRQQLDLSHGQWDSGGRLAPLEPELLSAISAIRHSSRVPRRFGT